MNDSLDFFSGVTVSDDVGDAEWVRAALRPWGENGVRVASLVPAVYPAHGRILHRAYRGSRAVKWREIAAAMGKPFDAESNFAELVEWKWDPLDQSPPEPWGEPEAGTLLPDQCAAVAGVLAAYTATPDDCSFCLWEGYGWRELEHLSARMGFRIPDLDASHLPPPGWTGGPVPVAGRFPVPIAPRVALEHRDCILFRGAATAAGAFRSPPMFQSPTLWWPADRAWCVASELDIYSTYVACSPAALRALVDHPGLEVLECSPEQPVDGGLPPLRPEHREPRSAIRAGERANRRRSRSRRRIRRWA